MTAQLEAKLTTIFAEAAWLGHPGGVISDADGGCFFLPEPDNRYAERFMRFVNDRLQGVELVSLARAAFTMADGNAAAMDRTFACTGTIDRRKEFCGALVELRWHDGSPNKDWSALKFHVVPPPLVD